MKDGDFKIQAESGEIRLQAFFKKNIPHGKWTLYRRGKPCLEFNMIKGEIDGNVHYDNNFTSCYFEFKNKKLNNEFIIKDSTKSLGSGVGDLYRFHKGELIYHEIIGDDFVTDNRTFKKGLLHGEHYHYDFEVSGNYNFTSENTEIKNYQNGYLHGEYKYFSKHENTFGQYEKGRKVGKWKSSYNNDITSSILEFYSPSLKTELDTFEEFYRNGRVMKKGHYLNEIKEGTWKTFFDNKKNSIKAKGNYIAGKKEGDWEYHCYGKSSDFFWLNILQDKVIISELEIFKVFGAYRNGIKQGYWKTFYPVGELFNEVLFLDGKKFGLSTICSSDNRILMQDLFDNDDACLMSFIYDSGQKIDTINFYDIYEKVSIQIDIQKLAINIEFDSPEKMLENDFYSEF